MGSPSIFVYGSVFDVNLVAALHLDGLPFSRSTEWQGISRRMTMASAEAAIFARCLARLGHWRVPANYDNTEWKKELAAVSACTAVLADREYDASRGVTRDAFVYQRVLTAMVTHYRQEWRFAARYRSQSDFAVLPQPWSPADIPEALMHDISKLSDTDRYLIKSLFWEGQSEAELAAQFGVTQQAISKRKAAILKRLRQDLKSDLTHSRGTQ